VLPRLANLHIVPLSRPPFICRGRLFRVQSPLHHHSMTSSLNSPWHNPQIHHDIILNSPWHHPQIHRHVGIQTWGPQPVLLYTRLWLSQFSPISWNVHFLTWI
jgi:hypothetical protein